MKHATAFIFVLIFIAAMAFAGELESWEYDGGFHEVIARADRVVIRHGGFNCCGPVDRQRILRTFTDQQEIARLNRMIQFEKTQTRESCKCCGYPGLDWYQGEKRIALTSVQHGRAVRWKGFPGDAQLTFRSSKDLARWLLNLRVPDGHGEFKAILEKEKPPTQ
jgi:hypothetical protein